MSVKHADLNYHQKIIMEEGFLSDESDIDLGDAPTFNDPPTVTANQAATL